MKYYVTDQTERIQRLLNKAGFFLVDDGIWEVKT